MAHARLRAAVALSAAICAAGLHTKAKPTKVASPASRSHWTFCAEPAEENPSAELGIPKIVHQTYKSKTFPPRLETYRQSWLKTFPDWEHKLWLDDDNRNLIKESYPWFLKTYDGYDQMIKRVDSVRLFYMHKYGGIYADTDMEVIRDPTSIFSTGHQLYFFAQNPMKCGTQAKVTVPQTRETVGEIPNALMASVPGHPFWIYLAQRLVKAKSEELVMWATGPSRLTETLAAYQAEYPEMRVALYTKDIWSPFKWGDSGCETIEECKTLFPNSYLISHWTGTWNHCEKGTCLKNDELKSHPYHFSSAPKSVNKTAPAVALSSATKTVSETPPAVAPSSAPKIVSKKTVSKRVTTAAPKIAQETEEVS